MATVGIDFFRVDRGGPTRTLLLLAMGLVTVGAASLGAHLVSRLPPDLAHGVSLVGGLMVLFGLVLGFGAMAMMLFENVWLAIRQEGVVLHDNGTETLVPWEELEAVAVEGKGWLVFGKREASVRWFAGGAARGIHARIEAARRKAAHGLLAP